MNRRIAKLALTLALCSSAAAGPPDPAPAPTVEQAWAALATVPALDAQFSQEQTRALLSRPLVSSGRIRFERPALLRWETLAPSPSSVVMNGSKLWLHVPELGEPQAIDLTEDPRIESLVKGLLVWLGGDLTSLRENYDLAWTPGPPSVAVLTPKDALLKGTIATISLTLAPDLRWVQSVTLTEPDGDATTLTLTDVSVLDDLPDTLFAPL